MKPPILIDENGSISIYPTALDAISDLEPIDVENREYYAYDSEGRELKLATCGPNVIIASVESETTHACELLQKLKVFLVQLGYSSEEVGGKSLESLVNILSNHVGLAPK